MREFPRCGPNGISVASVIVFFKCAQNHRYSSLSTLRKTFFPRLRGPGGGRENFSRASTTSSCLGDGPPWCVREFPRCGPNGIRVAFVSVNFSQKFLKTKKNHSPPLCRRCRRHAAAAATTTPPPILGRKCGPKPAPPPLRGGGGDTPLRVSSPKIF